MPVSDRTISYPLRHFINLARQGKNPACSSGEYRARQIALALLRNCQGLDESAICGINEFARLAADVPATLRAMIK